MRAPTPILLLSLTASVATSAVYDEVPVVDGRVVVFNGGEVRLTVQREVAVVAPDCATLEQHPSLAATLEWTPISDLSLGPTFNGPVNDFSPYDTSCTVARITIPGLGSRVVVAHDSDLAPRAFPQAYTDTSDIGEGVLAVFPDESQPIRPSSSGLVWTPTDLGTCSDGTLSWNTDYLGGAIVLDHSVTKDGCDVLTLDGSLHPSVEVCTGPVEMPEMTGRTVYIDRTEHRLSIEIVEHDRVVYGVHVDRGTDLRYGLHVQPDSSSEVTCLDDVDAACPGGGVDRAMVFGSGDLNEVVSLDAPLELEVAGGLATLWLGRASVSVLGCEPGVTTVVEFAANPR